VVGNTNNYRCLRRRKSMAPLKPRDSEEAHCVKASVSVDESRWPH